MKMKEKIKRKIEDLWREMEQKLEVFEEVCEDFKKCLEDKNLGEARLKIWFAIASLITIEEKLEDIELLEELLEDEGKTN